jgi:hypothetical protein
MQYLKMCNKSKSIEGTPTVHLYPVWVMPCLNPSSDTQIPLYCKSVDVVGI